MKSTEPSRVAIVIALLAGILLSLAWGVDLRFHARYAAVLLLAFAFVPAVHKRLNRWIAFLRSPSPRNQRITSTLLFFASGLYLIYSAVHAGRDLIPMYHDEHMYLLQARMLASGRLWTQAHEVGQFFDSFFVMVRPVYAATYFPGTALCYVPGIWLHLQPWITAVCICAGVVAMFYLVMTQLIDGAAGLLAAALVLSLEQFRELSVMTMSHTVLLLQTLLAIWIYLRWRQRHGLRWAILVGLLSGWTAITRPLDAVCLIIPLVVLMVIDLYGKPAKWRTLAVILFAASPMISLQLVFDKGVTGHLLRTPISVYGQTNFPGLSLSGGGDWRAPSTATLPQVRGLSRFVFTARIRQLCPPPVPRHVARRPVAPGGK